MADSRSRLSPDLAGVVASALIALVGRREAPGRPLRVAVAYSGGIDSTALLRLAAEVAVPDDVQLSAIHVHHGLSPHADAWATHCQAVCQALAVPLRIARVTVSVAGDGVEAAARRERYRAFAALDVDAVLLGHHRDDQAETVLFNLLRGAGAHGLSGMAAQRSLARAGRPPLRLLRPLLDVARADLACWLGGRGVAWIDDTSNVDESLSRNYLRRQILPRLAERFPASASLARAAVRLQEASALLDERADEDLAAGLAGGGVSLSHIRGLSPARQRNLLHRMIVRGGARVASAARLEALRQQVIGAPEDARGMVSFGTHAAHLWRGALWLVPARPAAPAVPVGWAGATRVEWAAGSVEFVAVTGSGVAARFLAGTRWTLRARQGGAQLRLAENRPRQKVKHLLQEAGVPPWERDRLPTLWRDERLIWLPGFPIDPEARALPDEAGWLPVWHG